AQEVRAPFAAAVPAGAPMSFADLIEGVSPAVVTIQARADSRDPQEAPNMEGLPPQLREWLERQFGGQVNPNPQPRQALGSGFFISAEGHIVTNNHVVEGATEITIGTSDGETYEARIIGLDPQTDLALLKVDEADDFPFVTLDDNPQYRVGDWVVAVGNPFGLGGTATAGIISATGREIGNSTYNDFIQIDAPINSGNSGGPTFDLEGNVVGVNSQIFSPTGGNVGIGFAIPSDVASRIVGELLEDGRVSRGWLGVSIQNVTEDIAGAVGLDEARGAIISSIVAEGPADNAGFEREDVILEVNGEAVDGSRELTRRIGEFAAGERVNFLVLRDGRERTVRAVLGDRPSEDDLNNRQSREEAEASVALFGIQLSPLDDRSREALGLGEDVVGLVVDEVNPGGEADNKGIRRGDVVLEAGGEAVGTPDAFRAAVDEAREAGRSAILLLVEGRGGQRYVALQLDAAEE
ncbi:MAG: Do family serine endopeptidase, partial [Alphaproteobacteria bacterium]|nr:Do family serine endopeptidase [Alphaproteobacteria bacterium]